MLKPLRLIETHMECRALRDTLLVLTDLLAFDKVGEADSQVALKHPNSDWRLVVHEAGPDAPDKQMLNHWGVRVVTRAEVDAAAEYLKAHGKRYGVQLMREPSFAHGSYSLYFLEPGTNGWEIECYEDALSKGKGAERLGGVWAPHWADAAPRRALPRSGIRPAGVHPRDPGLRGQEPLRALLYGRARPRRPSRQQAGDVPEGAREPVLRGMCGTRVLEAVRADVPLHDRARIRRRRRRRPSVVDRVRPRPRRERPRTARDAGHRAVLLSGRS